MATESHSSVLAVIPARYASTRFPGKALAPLAGKPLVIHVYERTARASCVGRTVIATDDERVRDAALKYGAEVEMTRADHPSGTDRVAEVAERSDAEIIVNVQGDEPLIEPEAIDAVVRPLLESGNVPMSTVRCTITDPRELDDPNVVKVVCDINHRALYFSRRPIPWVRDGNDDNASRNHWRHIGLYAYRRDFLLNYAKLAPTPLEKLEKLEQLRALENGFPIVVVDTAYRSVSVDTPDDLETVRTLLEEQSRA